jgi:hypothetical protein
MDSKIFLRHIPDRSFALDVDVSAARLVSLFHHHGEVFAGVVCNCSKKLTEIPMRYCFSPVSQSLTSIHITLHNLFNFLTAKADVAIRGSCRLCSIYDGLREIFAQPARWVTG